MEQDTVKRSSCFGFSLVELLIVVAIMSVLLLLTIPAFNAVLEANKITEGARLVTGELDTASQLASARNRTIEVRLIRKPGDTYFTAIQLWWPDGVFSPAGRAVGLPTPLVILGDNTLSPLPGTDGMFAGTMPAGGTYGGNPYTAFRIRASGMVEPFPTSRAAFYLTLAPDRYAGGGTPINYATLQINPDTGRTMMYRP